MPSSSLIASAACSVPITPATAPRMPASSQRGTSPGGGGTGTTSALAEILAGRGNKTKGGSENVEKGQGTGQSGRVLPDEFRSGLDEYFNRFEKERR